MRRENLKSALLFAVLAGVLSSCSTWRKLDYTERGAVIGAGSGAVVGGSVGGTGGALLGGAGGAVGGGLIGHEMDEDRRDHDSRRY